MTKILKNYTIIPPWLYVKRNADRQLFTIIEEMGRPGYVLVSRQMGKTNLMLNAKRELEGSDVVFVYVDLSSQFETPRDCFRNIIDIAVNTHLVQFESITSIITAERTSKGTQPPNTEHEAELLMLLRCHHGKIVIVLDEIDALTSTSYSDQIFAQIRSVYFAGRTNYSEFSRLTYVLSGVAEPSNIIKDKNKSPFNIGDKIYLDDFTYGELLSLVNKLGVVFPLSITEKIYEMTSGHPRMSWDLCSKLEDIYLETGVINDDDVVKAIHLLYTKSYDHAPIDHIRDLVQNNYEIRKAVRCLINGENNLSDNIKTTLYLAGIIKSDFNTNQNFSIKNKIILSCLSNEWLDSIDILNKSYFNLASEQEILGKYKEAINYYKLYIVNFISNDVASKGIVYTAIGNCYMAIEDYCNALKYFILSNEEKSTKVSGYYNGNLFRIGLTYLRQGEYDKSAEIFDELRNNDRIEDNLKYRATLNYSSVMLQINYEEHKKSVLELLTDLAEKVLLDENIETELLSEVLILTYYYIARIYSSLDEREMAIDYYFKAIKSSPPKFRPYIYLCIIRIMVDVDSKLELLAKSTEVIIQNNITQSIAQYTGDESLAFMYLDEEIILEHLMICYEHDLTVLTDHLSSYYLNNINKNADSYILFKALLEQSVKQRNFRSTIAIANKFIHLLENMPNYDGYELLSSYRLLANINYKFKTNQFNDTQKYIELFEVNGNFGREVVYEDILTFVTAVIYYRKHQQYTDALKTCKIIAKYFDTCSDEIRINFASIFYFIASISDHLNNKIQAIEYARRTINISNHYDVEHCRIMDIQRLDEIRDHCNDIIRRCSQKEPIIVSSKIGRNDRCYCGSGLKYKKCHGK